MVICTSPQLFAAYHVLLRLWEPRHPPYALSNFLSNPSLFFVSLFVISLFSHHVKELSKPPLTPPQEGEQSQLSVNTRGIEPHFSPRTSRIYHYPVIGNQ